MISINVGHKLVHRKCHVGLALREWMVGPYLFSESTMYPWVMGRPAPFSPVPSHALVPLPHPPSAHQPSFARSLSTALLSSYWEHSASGSIFGENAFLFYKKIIYQ